MYREDEISSVEVLEAGGSSRDCPPPCRCEGDGMLQRVDCVDVSLRDVPSNLSSFTSSLRLAGNNLTVIPKDAFTGLIGLRELTLQNNHLKRVPSEAFENLRNLRSLRLDANFISRLPAASFKGLSSLRHLWLDDNVLTEVPVVALSDLTQLQALTLALNNIRHVPDRAFASLCQLVALHLHDNHIRSLGPRCFDGLHNLEILDLSFNKISSFPAAVRRLKNLRDLNLQNNNIAVVPENAFTGNPSIQTINIWNNPVHTVGHSAFQLLPELQTLFLSGSITELPDFTGTNRLETLSITGSHISFLPSSICEELPNLQTLDLSHNLIQSLPSFSRCRKMQNINMHHNSVHETNPGTVQQMKEFRSQVADQLFDLQSCVFLHCVKLTSLQENNSPPTCCLDLLHLSVCLLFILSVTLNLLVLVSGFLSSSVLGPPSSPRLLALLFWFRLLSGVSGTCVLMVDCLCEFNLQTDPGRGLVSFLFALSSEACIFLMMVVVFENLRCVQVTCAVCCSFTLAVASSPALLLLFNTSCFLFMTVTHLSRRRREEDVTLNLRGVRDEALMLTFLLLTNTVLSLSAYLLRLPALLSPGVSTSAVLLLISALPSCLDPLLFIVFSPCFAPEFQSFQGSMRGTVARRGQRTATLTAHLQKDAANK
ncbi:leucine-rich repeat-containing G-protein coupled receptor 5-like isoform X1 [Thunnus albacares]|uniref:leucine-rich repeat-containing G-protein coupled receptor 5-like isoform X1 n=1 Tax=Thunnus albacares TaxID=8236 RepID=UPI001CF60D47|nr:leucine-rich repeat-containing G-protein coupled receptor 5-like isoform X1 [Thunnus albacares]